MMDGSTVKKDKNSDFKKQRMTKPKVPKNKTVTVKKKLMDFSPYVSKYEKDYKYTSSNGWSDLTTPGKAMAFRDAMSDWGYGYSITIDSYNSSSTFHNVVMKVCIYDYNNRNIATVMGISNQYLIDFATNTKSSACERAQTIALGKALSLLGISINGNLYSSEEMLAFQVMQDFDTRQMLEDLAKKVYSFDEDTKKDMKVNNIRIRDLLPCYEETDSVKELKKKVDKLIITAKNA